MDLKNPTRTEALLANIAGYTGVPIPDMKNATRSERLLKEILDNGGGGGGGGDVTKEYVDNAISNAVADIDDDLSALSDTVADKVDKVNGKGLSTNDYTDADKALVQDSPITVTATASTISTANGKLRKLTIFGKSEVVDGTIKSAGEGYAVVDLGTLNWSQNTNDEPFFYTNNISNIIKSTPNNQIANLLIDKYTATSRDILVSGTINNAIAINYNGIIQIRDTAYTDATAFKSAMSGVILCYQLADPSQGNTIAIKTDNGSGINGTMATFSTSTPLYGVSDTVRDVMEWSGSAGEVTKKCGNVDLGSATYTYDSNNKWFSTTSFASTIKPTTDTQQANILSSIYAPNTVGLMLADQTINMACATNRFGTLIIRNTDYTDPAQFKSAMSGVMLIYEFATPTTEPLTTTELASLSALKTHAPQTAITINDNPEFEVEAYANTANGQMISDMQPTRSPLLTLSASGWTNNAQTVTYTHDKGKRNTIDVEPLSIKAWTAAGILATAETASTITFECDTTPTSDLSFRVTSMEVR